MQESQVGSIENNTSPCPQYRKEPNTANTRDQRSSNTPFTLTSPQPTVQSPKTPSFNLHTHLSPAIASLTYGSSSAYLQQVFMTALLSIAQATRQKEPIPLSRPRTRSGVRILRTGAEKRRRRGEG